MTHQWVSVAEAARRLGVSVSTIRRMVEDGKLIGEREPLGGSRERFRVRFDAPETPQEASDSKTADAPLDAPAVHQDVSAAISAAVGPLTELIRGQAETIAALSEKRGEWQERAVAANRRADELEGERDAARAEVERLKVEARRSWLDKLLGRGRPA